jgi:hypothetical protein
MPQNKTVITGKVQKDSNTKFKIKKDKDTELDVDVEIQDDGDYVVDKLSIDDLPATMNDGTAIRWFNNFAIKKNGNYINQSFKVTIAGLSSVRSAKKKVVIFDGNTNNGKPFVFEGDITNDTLELTDGDPAVGSSPP